MTIIDAMRDPQVFVDWFASRSWDAWRVFLAALFGLRMDDAATQVYRKHTGRATEPQDAFSEAWVVVGRRGGKSLMAALCAVFLACFRDYRQFLKPGEVGTVAVIAADRKQARVVMRYIRGFLEIPLLKTIVFSETKESLELTNRVIIEVHSASFRSTRGYTLLAVICDEIAFWRSDEYSASPDKEILAAIRPGLATIPGSLLLCISSPYARRGALWEAYQRHHGKDSRILVWQAASREMNPSLLQSVVDQAYEDDEASASAEFGAQFRRDLESFIDSGLARSLVVPGRRELPPVPGVNYAGFADAAGGSGQDSYTMAIAHKEPDGRFLVDAVREKKPPFSPEQTTQEFAEMFVSYGIRRISGDRYAGSWPAEQFRKHGVSYEPAAKPKSELYKDALPLFNSQRVELLDIPRLVSQLCGLERRTARGGHDTIDHGAHQHDDLINSVCGAFVTLGTRCVVRWAPVGAPPSEKYLGVG